MMFSIVVPAYSEEAFIERSLLSIRNQTYRDYELIVVVRPSTDRTEEIARKYADRVIIEKEAGLGNARNVGTANAKGEVIVFVDADTIVPPTLLEKLNEVFKDGRVVGIIPKFYVYDKSVKGATVYLMLNALAKIVTKVKVLFYGMFIAIRKGTLLRVGGFKNIFGEDIDLSMRLDRFYRINRNRFVKYYPAITVYTSSRRIVQLGFWRALKLWSLNLIRKLIWKKDFVGYL